MTGGGLDIGGTSDQFQFVYQPMTGDAQLVAWLGNLQATDTSAKAGVMIREALTGPAAHASVFVTGSGGFAFDRRTAAGGASSETNGSTGNASGWLKIVREGSVFSAFESQDGSQWTLIGTDTILMPATVVCRAGGHEPQRVPDRNGDIQQRRSLHAGGYQQSTDGLDLRSDNRSKLHGAGKHRH